MQATSAPSDVTPQFSGIFEPTTFNTWGNGAIDNNRAIDPTQQTFVITHGFWNTGGNAENGFTPESWISNAANSIRKQNPNANIIVTDWDSRLLAPISYPVMGDRTRGVANEITQFLTSKGIAPQNTTLIGHSLGAHISGLVGQNFNGQIKTIFGLDPAGPLFDVLLPDWRLSPDDAQRVVAIHSSRTFGINIPVANLDIYLNPSELFHPGSNNAIDNHGYATTFFDELLNGKSYGNGTINQDFLNNQNGNWVVNTYDPNATPITWPPNLDINVAIEYFWNLLRSHYQNQNGRPISDSTLSAIIQNRIKAINADIQTLGDLLAQGKISLPTWQEEMARALKLFYVELALLGRGGADRMTRNDYLAIGRALKEQYKYLRKFAQDIAQGKMSIAQFKARLKLYVEKARLAFALMMKQNFQEQEYKYMRRFLDKDAKTCYDCLGYARAGVQLIGALPLPTEKCICNANCKCTVKYYKSLEEAVLNNGT